MQQIGLVSRVQGAWDPVLLGLKSLLGVPCLGPLLVCFWVKGGGDGGAGSYLWEVQLKALSGDGLAGRRLVQLHVEEGREGSLSSAGLGQLLVAT